MEETIIISFWLWQSKITLKRNIKQVFNKSRRSKFSSKFSHNDSYLIHKNQSQLGMNYRNFSPHQNDVSFFLSPVEGTEVREIIIQLKDGLPINDGIAPKGIKCILNNVAASLTRLTNLSFSKGVFLNDLNVALVASLYKAYVPMVFGNHRPISLLPLFWKLLEKLMYNMLVRFQNKCKIINKNKLGFRDNYSTYIALLVMFENVWNDLDNSECTIGISLFFKMHLTPLIRISY